MAAWALCRLPRARLVRFSKRPHSVLAGLALALGLTGGAEAQDQCIPLLDFAELCIPDTMGFAHPEAAPEVVFTGPVPETGLWRAIVFPLSPPLDAPEHLRSAVEWQIARAANDPALTVTRLRDEATEIGDHDAHLIVNGITTPNETIPRPFVYLGLRIADRVVVVRTSDANPREDFDDIIESARIVAGMIQAVDAPQ